MVMHGVVPRIETHGKPEHHEHNYPEHQPDDQAEQAKVAAKSRNADTREYRAHEGQQEDVLQLGAPPDHGYPTVRPRS